MKQVLSFLMVVLLMQVHAQDSLSFKKRLFNVKVLTVTGQSLSGYLNHVSDTALSLSDQQVIFSPYRADSKVLTTIDFKSIREVSIRRKGSTSRGLLAGALVGIGIGAIAGLISGDDKRGNENSWCILCMTAGEKAAAYGLGLGIVGGITGTIAGALARKRFVIGSQKQPFDAMRLSVLESINAAPLK